MNESLLRGHLMSTSQGKRASVMTLEIEVRSGSIDCSYIHRGHLNTLRLLNHSIYEIRTPPKPSSLLLA